MTRASTYNAEVAVLSTVLNQLDTGWFGHVERVAGTKNGASLFNDPRNGAVYAAINEATKASGIANPAVVADLLSSKSELFDADPSDYVDSILLTPIIPSIEQLDSTLKRLEDERTVRRQVRSIQEVLTDIDDPEVSVNPEDIVARLNTVVESTALRTETKTFAEITREVKESGAPMWTVSTGIPSIDRILGGSGLESGCFTLVAARAKVGKTIFMNNLLLNLLEADDQEENGVVIPVVLNLETKEVEFVAKVLSRYIANPELPWGVIKKYLSSDPETLEMISRTKEEQIKDALEWSEEQDWYAEFNKSTSMQDIYALVAKVKAESPDNARIVLLVDYIQLQVQNARFEREEITQLSRLYKKMAGELGISVFSLAQLNRNSAEGEPRVSDLRGSGSLEQDADSIILLYHPEKVEGQEDDFDHSEIMVNAATTRLAQGEKFRLAKDAQNQLITELSPEREAELDREAADFSEFVEDIN